MIVDFLRDCALSAIYCPGIAFNNEWQPGLTSKHSRIKNDSENLIYSSNTRWERVNDCKTTFCAVKVHSRSYMQLAHLILPGHAARNAALRSRWSLTFVPLMLQSGRVLVTGKIEGLIRISGRIHNSDDIVATVLAIEPVRFVYRGR